MNCDRLGVCKIGITDNVSNRISGVQTGCPYEISDVWQSKNISNNAECEKELHEYFKGYKTYGEWFKAPFYSVCQKANEICGGQHLELECFFELKRVKAQLQDRIFNLELENAQLKNELKCYKEDKYKTIIKNIKRLVGGV